jgi:hypothetical protein
MRRWQERRDPGISWANESPTSFCMVAYSPVMAVDDSCGKRRDREAETALSQI